MCADRMTHPCAQKRYQSPSFLGVDKNSKMAICLVKLSAVAAQNVELPCRRTLVCLICLYLFYFSWFTTFLTLTQGCPCNWRNRQFVSYQFWCWNSGLFGEVCRGDCSMCLCQNEPLSIKSSLFLSWILSSGCFFLCICLPLLWAGFYDVASVIHLQIQVVWNFGSPKGQCGKNIRLHVNVTSPFNTC